MNASESKYLATRQRFWFNMPLYLFLWDSEWVHLYWCLFVSHKKTYKSSVKQLIIKITGKQINILLKVKYLSTTV